jgi:uncharacterized repeat protein (TIGR03803 family)
MRKMFLLASLVAFSIFTANLAFAAASEKTLYDFTGGSDGGNPLGGVIRDSSGNLYGTTEHGGSGYAEDCNPNYGCGAVFEVSPSDGSWKERVLYSFCASSGCPDGEFPKAGLVFDSLGNLYGTTFAGGVNGSGVVFELAHGSHGWSEEVLYNFCSIPGDPEGCLDGAEPNAGVVFDSNGNLYGTTEIGGASTGAGGGVVFELSPGTLGWEETVVYPFCYGCIGGQPEGGVTLDAAGNLYGTTNLGGNANCANTYTCGTVYELSPASSGGWTYVDLYNFCPVKGCTDGALPYGNLVIDSAGNLYGTASAYGPNGGGVAYELSPTASGFWDENVLHSFCSSKNCADGSSPTTGMVFNSAGNLYGTTSAGGTGIGGVAFELLFKLGAWHEAVLHDFCTALPCSDGGQPTGTLTLDPKGNLYGASSGYGGGNAEGGSGAVFKLTP